jgi:hypothetical protein
VQPASATAELSILTQPACLIGLAGFVRVQAVQLASETLEPSIWIERAHSIDSLDCARVQIEQLASATAAPYLEQSVEARGEGSIELLAYAKGDQKSVGCFADLGEPLLSNSRRHPCFCVNF